MDATNSMVSLPTQAKRDIGDPEFGCLKALTHAINIITGSRFFVVPFSFCGFIETRWLDLSHLFPISAASVHFAKYRADWEAT